MKMLLITILNRKKNSKIPKFWCKGIVQHFGGFAFSLSCQDDMRWLISLLCIATIFYILNIHINTDDQHLLNSQIIMLYLAV